MNEMIVKEELKKFNVTDSALAELHEKFMPLAINGVDDKTSYLAVDCARKTVKGLRVDVEKKRKELKEESLSFGRAVDQEARRITEKLLVIEQSLAEKQKIIDDEKDAIAEKKRKEKADIMQKRIDKLNAVGSSINLEQISLMTADQFDIFFLDEEEKFKVRMKLEEQQAVEAADLLAKQAALNRIEQDRLAKEAELAQIKQAELARVEKQQAEERAALQAAHEEIERQKQAEIEIKLEEDRKIKAREESDRLKAYQESLKPDIEKLKIFSSKIISILDEKPSLKNKDAELSLSSCVSCIKDSLLKLTEL